MLYQWLPIDADLGSMLFDQNTEQQHKSTGRSEKIAQAWEGSKTEARQLAGAAYV